VYFILTVRASLEDSPSLTLWSTSFLRLANVARNADRIVHASNITRRNVVLSHRYGGANCNLCLIAVVVGAPRQRELCRRRTFLRFKAFQEGTVSPSFATENITVASRFSSTSSQIASLLSICESSKCRHC